MSDKTYVLIECEDSTISEVTVCGGGEVAIIAIDWDDLETAPEEAEGVLFDVMEAIGDLQKQGHTGSALNALSNAATRLEVLHDEHDEDDEDDDDDLDLDDLEEDDLSDDDEEDDEDDEGELAPV